MLESEPLAVSGLGQPLDGVAQAQAGELHLVGVDLAKPEPTGLPEVAHRLRAETLAVAPQPHLPLPGQYSR